MDRNIQRAFVTGATGNLGQVVVPELQQRSIDVVALVRKPVKGASYRALKGTLESIHKQASEIEKADAIFHLASSRGNDPSSVYNCDALGTLQLLLAWSHGPFVYPSSQGIYGVPHAPLVEDTPYDPTYWFDIGHVINEMQLRVESLRRNLGPAVSIRLALMFPTGKRLDDQFFNKTLHQCLNDVTFLVDSDEGLAKYGTSFIGPGDLGRACVDALTIKESGPYNVAGGFCAWGDLVDTVNRLGRTKARIEVRRDPTPKHPKEVRLPQSRSELVDDKFRNATKFMPSETLEQVVDNWLRVILDSKSGKVK